MDGSASEVASTLVVNIVDDIPLDSGSTITISSGNLSGNAIQAIYDWQPGADRSPSASLDGILLTVGGEQLLLLPVDGETNSWMANAGGIDYYLRLDSDALNSGLLAFSLYQVDAGLPVDDASRVDIATVTLDSNGDDTVTVNAREFGFTELDTTSDAATPGAPVGSVYLPAGDSVDVLVTAFIGDVAGSVNTSGQGWGVKSSSGGGNAAQTLDAGEALVIGFYGNGSLADGLQDGDKRHGVQDFRFTPSGYAGGMKQASLVVSVVVVPVDDPNSGGEVVRLQLDGLVEDNPIVLSAYLAAQVPPRDFANGYLIQSVRIESAASGGLRIDQPAYPEYSLNTPPDLQASFTLSIADADGDSVSTDFILDLSGQSDDGITVVVGPDPAAQVQPDATPIAPVVVDLDGDGFRFLSREAGVQFDYTGSGAKQSTGWLPDTSLKPLATERVSGHWVGR